MAQIFGEFVESVEDELGTGGIIGGFLGSGAGAVGAAAGSQIGKIVPGLGPTTYQPTGLLDANGNPRDANFDRASFQSRVRQARADKEISEFTFKDLMSRSEQSLIAEKGSEEFERLIQGFRGELTSAREGKGKFGTRQFLEARREIATDRPGSRQTRNLSPTEKVNNAAKAAEQTSTAASSLPGISAVGNAGLTRSSRGR